MNPPGQLQDKGKPSLLTARTLVLALLLLAVFGFGMAVEWFAARKTHEASVWTPYEGIRTKPGPWGDLYYIPFTIAAPDEVLPVRKFEAAGTHWFFKNVTRDDLVKFLQFAQVPQKLQDALLDPACLRIQPDGIDVAPSWEVLTALPPDSRTAIYSRLANYPENSSEICYLHKATLQTRFEGSQVSDGTMSLFKNLCCDSGNYVVFAGLPSLLAHIPDYAEKVRFMKALTRERTMQFRLRITPGSDINAIAKYWSKGCYATDIHTMLESFAKVKGGTWVDILEVLPPIPSSELYFYPIISDNPLNARSVKRDCHWTSFNFFRDVPDNRFTDAEYTRRVLENDYYPISGDPLYGDLVMFSKPDGSIIHSAVYLADDIVFTKNGDTVMHPWMLSTVSDLTEQYSFQVLPAGNLTVTYYRNKFL